MLQRGATGAREFSRSAADTQRAGVYEASPWAYGGKVFCLSEYGETFVLAASDELTVLRVNELAEDDMCLATPAIAGKRLLIRKADSVFNVFDQDDRK